MSSSTTSPRLRNRVRAAITRDRARIIEVANWIHENPELAYQEHRASALLADHLRDIGFAVERPCCGLDTAFRAVRAGKRPGGAVAVIAEYDALPGIGHGCGHNLIAASSLAAAIGLGAVLDDLGGTFVIMGTPAEESGGGKIALAKEGAFRGLDAVLMIHYSGEKTSVPATWPAGTTLANAPLQIEFFGIPAHAAGDPDKGVNALNAVIKLFSGIDALRQHMRSESRIHGIITNGGDAANVVPAYSSAALFVRAPTRDEALDLAEKVRNVARGAALMTGCEVRMTDGALYTDMRPSYVLGERFLANMVAVDLKPVLGNGGRGMYSTDFGNVSHVVPASMGLFAISHEPIPGHSPQVVAASGSDFGHEQLLKAATAMALTAHDILADVELRHRAREEHRVWGQREHPP